MIAARFLSGLAVCKAARISEMETQLSTDLGDGAFETLKVRDDTQAPETCFASDWFHCDKPAVWNGEMCCLQGYYTCKAGGFMHCDRPSVWSGEHCCTKANGPPTTTTTTTTQAPAPPVNPPAAPPRPPRPRNQNGGYDEFKGKACQGRNELGAFRGFSTCQSKCNMDARCVSFEWIPNMLRCQLSTSCTGRYLSTVPGVVVYIKKSASYTMAPKQTHYLGCYINKGSGSARINGHVKNLSVQDCRELAAKEQKKFFGMEYPQGSSTPGQVQCLPLDRMPTNTKVADAECEAEGLFEGYRLGSAHRLAMYSNVAAAPSSYYYYYN